MNDIRHGDNTPSQYAFNLDAFIVDVKAYHKQTKARYYRTAEDIGVSNEHLSRVMAGKVMPSLMLVKALLKVINRKEHEYRIVG
jgi:predicted transcriptional regulator